MNNDVIYKFANRYGITRLEIEDDIQYVDTFYHRTPYVAGPSMVKLKMPLQQITELAVLDLRLEEEYYIRRDNPAVADAYDKYQMLLALCK